MWIQNSYSCYSRATAFTPLRCYWPKVCTSGWQIVEKLSNIHFCRHRNCLSIANIGKPIPYFFFNNNTRKYMFFLYFFHRIGFCPSSIFGGTNLANYAVVPAKSMRLQPSTNRSAKMWNKIKKKWIILCLLKYWANFEYLAQIRTVKMTRTIQQTTGIVVWRVFDQ